MLVIRVSASSDIKASPYCTSGPTDLTDFIDFHHPLGGWNKLPCPTQYPPRTEMRHWVCGCTNAEDFRLWWPDQLTEAFEALAIWKPSAYDMRVTVLDAPAVSLDQSQCMFDTRSAVQLAQFTMAEYNACRTEIFALLKNGVQNAIC